MAQTATLNMMREEDARRKWTDWPGWDYVPGIAFIVIGAFAFTQPLLTSLATSITLGAMLCVAGAFSLVGGLVNVGHRGGWLVALLGALSLVVGMMLLNDPARGAASLMWLIGAWLIGGAVFELALSFSVPAGRGWLIIIGLFDLVLGAFVLMMDPLEAFVFLGYVAGASLIYRGLWSVVFASDIHQLKRMVAGSDASSVEPA